MSKPFGVKRTIAFLLLLLPLAGIFYNLFLLPLDLQSAESEMERRGYQIRENLNTDDDAITAFAHDSIGIDKKFNMKTSIIPRNLAGNKYEIFLEIFSLDSTETITTIARSPVFKEFFRRLPGVVERNLGDDPPVILEYRMMIRTPRIFSSTIYLSESGAILLEPETIMFEWEAITDDN